MTKKNKNLIAWGVIGLGVVVAIIFSVQQTKQPGEHDALAQCIADSGTTFYGAFWCPHCNNQKKLFGNSEKLLPYVECSNPNRSMKQECVDAGIESYPTWEFTDGSRLTGEQSLETLAEKSNCSL